MTLRLRNRWEHVGGEWWRWAAFIDDDGSGDLGRVERVEYVLHPLFEHPVRTVTDPARGFEMRTAGWGAFPLVAFVFTRDGQKLKLTHEIELMDEPPIGSSA